MCACIICAFSNFFTDVSLQKLISTVKLINYTVLNICGKVYCDFVTSGMGI